jgi:hypothetical protein
LINKDNSINVLHTSDDLEKVIDYFEFCRWNKKTFSMSLNRLSVVKIVKIKNSSIEKKPIINGEDFK